MTVVHPPVLPETLTAARPAHHQVIVLIEINMATDYMDFHQFEIIVFTCELSPDITPRSGSPRESKDSFHEQGILCSWPGTRSLPNIIDKQQSIAWKAKRSLYEKKQAHGCYVI